MACAHSLPAANGRSPLTVAALRPARRIGPSVARGEQHSPETEQPRQRKKDVSTRAQPMDLSIWIPAMFVLGLAALALMFAFVYACDKV